MNEPTTTKNCRAPLWASAGKSLWGILLVALMGAPALSRQPPPLPAAAKLVPVDLKKLTVQELIERLKSEPEFWWDIEWRNSPKEVIGDPFLGLETDPAEALVQSEERKPGMTRVVGELVRRGTDSLPGLLAHLEDARLSKQFVWIEETKAGIVRHELEPPRTPATFRLEDFFRQFVPGDWTRLSYVEKIKKPAMGEQGATEGWRYTMRVGDLCYVAIGQIVNRPLHPIFRFQGEHLVMTSPAILKGIAESCREKWGRLATPEKHKESLINDGFTMQSATAPLFGLSRLYFYYPEEGEKRILNHIKKAFVEEHSVSNFLHYQLLKVSEEDYHKVADAYALVDEAHTAAIAMLREACNWHLISGLMGEVLEYFGGYAKSMAQDHAIRQTLAIPPSKVLLDAVRKFEKTQGKLAASRIPIELCSQFLGAHTGNLRYVVKQHLARAVLKQVFPTFLPDQHSFVEVAIRSDCSAFLANLPRYDNPKIDRAIFEVLQRIPHFGPTNADGEYTLARTCVYRLAGGPIEPELRAYLEKKVQEAKKDPAPNAVENDLPMFNELLSRLNK